MIVDSGDHCGSASWTCAGDWECCGFTRTSTMWHHRVPSLTDLPQLMMLVLMLSVVSAVLRLWVGDGCGALCRGAARRGVTWLGVAWGAVAWGWELLWSHPAAGGIAGLVEEVKALEEHRESAARGAEH